MDEANQERTVDALREWSKWLIGIDFGGAAGCAFIFEQSPVSVGITPFLVTAIVSFGVSFGFSVLLLRELALISEVLPLPADADGRNRIYRHRTDFGVTIGRLTQLQLGFLASAALFFFIWVIVKAVSG